MTSAENGDVSAQTELAIKYIEGDGVNKNYIEAAKWFKKAAEQGYAKAQYNLGVCYENGQGVNKNISEAKKWYMTAAIQGDEFAKEALKRLDEDF